VALSLQRHGLTHVRPLLEGISGWRARGFPLQTLAGGGAPSS
jgi:rhodanese-related sulfurtransferase